MSDNVTFVYQDVSSFAEPMGLTGEVTMRAFCDGELIHEWVEKNLITQYGDQYYAERAAAIGANAAATGMKLGTGTTAAAKTGAGAGLVTYLAGTNVGFDSTPASSLISGTRKITYISSWGAGVGTGAPQELVLVNDATGNATSPTTATIARVVLTSPPAKGASDVWTATWEHNFLGQ